MIACSGAMTWMKMDYRFREAFSDEQILLLQHREPVNGGRTGASGPGSIVFFFQNCKQNDVIEFIVVLLLDVIK